jgi:hypothetical protein
MSRDCGIITFFSSQHAVHAEKILKQHGFTIELIPGPKEISPNCGVALQYDYLRTEEIKALLAAGKVAAEAFHNYRLPDRKSLLDKIMGR